MGEAKRRERANPWQHHSWSLKKYWQIGRNPGCTEGGGGAFLGLHSSGSVVFRVFRHLTTLYRQLSAFELPLSDVTLPGKTLSSAPRKVVQLQDLTLYSIESVQSWSPSLVWVRHRHPRHLAEVLLKWLLRPGCNWKAPERVRQKANGDLFIYFFWSGRWMIPESISTCRHWQTRSQTSVQIP